MAPLQHPLFLIPEIVLPFRRLGLPVRHVAAAAVLVTAACASTGTRAPASHASAPRAATGTVDSFTVASAALGETLTVLAYRPPGYGASGQCPAIYTLQRGVYFDRLHLPAWMDSAVSDGMRPAVLVSIPDPDAHGLDAFRPDTRAGEAFARFIADEVVPAVESRYAVGRSPEGRLLLGFSAGANVLLDVAVRHPGRFGRVAAVSPGWMFRDERGGIGTEFHDAALANIAHAPAGLATRFWFVWGDGPSEWEHRSRLSGREVMAALRARGAPVVDAGLAPGDHALALARTTARDAIAFLLALSPDLPAYGTMDSLSRTRAAAGASYAIPLFHE